jgi:uncharacterized repeat protein (TIGR03803 family)
MKTHTKNLFLQPVLIAALALMLAGRMTAQTFTTLHSFTPTTPPSTGSDGGAPWAGLILSGNTLYGTTVSGGSSYRGTVFAVNTDGSAFTILYSFTGFDDGAQPYAGLILSGNTLYGTASGGGSSGSGTVFAVNTNGTGFTTLHSFTAASGSYPHYVNSDGVDPEGVLILSGNTLYGTARQGGSSGCGTVFAVNTDGTSFTTLYSFTGNNDIVMVGPYAGLILSSNTLYGTANGGGSSSNGTVFAVNTNGTGFTNLHSFTKTSGSLSTNSDGAYPGAGLILSGNTLYGMARRGGSSGYGTVFSLSLPTPPPQLTIIPSGANVILAWPTNAAVFTLQSTTNLGSSAVWTTNSPAPVVVNGQNTVTNPISGAQQFYRLSQ